MQSLHRLILVVVESKVKMVIVAYIAANRTLHQHEWVRTTIFSAITAAYGRLSGSDAEGLTTTLCKAGPIIP
jgi:hypothetical protein